MFVFLIPHRPCVSTVSNDRPRQALLTAIHSGHLACGLSLLCSPDLSGGVASSGCAFANFAAL